MPKTIFLIVQFLLCSKAFGVFFSFSRSVFSELNEGRVLRSFTGISVNGCMLHCRQRPACDYIHYERRFHLCVLISIANAPELGTATVADSGLVSVDIYNISVRTHHTQLLIAK